MKPLKTTFGEQALSHYNTGNIQPGLLSAVAPKKFGMTPVGGFGLDEQAVEDNSFKGNIPGLQ